MGQHQRPYEPAGQSRSQNPLNRSEFPSGDIRDRQRAFEASIVRARADTVRRFQTWGAVTEPFAEVRRGCSRGRHIEETKTGEHPSTVCSTGLNQ